MRLTAILFLAAVLQVSARGFGQEVSVSKKKIGLERFFREVNKQTGYNFIYNEELVSRTRSFSLNITKMPLRQALDLVLRDKPISYRIVDKTIILRPGVQVTDEAKFRIVTIPVKGRVLDASGNPLSGVSIVQKGKPTGTSTDESGYFSLEVEENSTIEISIVGYMTKAIRVGKDTELNNITLDKLANDLGEVIVIGYGTTTKGKNITAVSTLKAEKIQNLGATSVGEALAGRVPGVLVNSSGGGPGKKPQISIRGGGTPLYVIDDIISTEFQFQTLNINDIDNISFLKDGPATAIYGVAAGNGIVLVTTKRGGKGKVSVNYNYGHDWVQPTILPNKISSYEIATLTNSVDEMEGNPGRYAPEDVQKYKDQSDPLNFPNTDWQSTVLKKFAPQNRHNLSVAGGGKQSQYYASLGYLDQGTLYRENTNWLKRYNYRVSVSSDFEKIGLKTTIALYGTTESQRNPNSSYGSGYYYVWGHIQNSSPMEKAFADLEHTRYSNKGDHPLVEISPESGYARNEDRDINGNVVLQWSVPGVKGLSLKGNANYRQFNSSGRSWNATAPQYSIGSDVPVATNKPNLSLVNTNGYNYVLQGFGTYDRAFGDHSISAMFGYEQAYVYGETSTTGRNSFDFNFDQINYGPQANVFNNGSMSESVRNAFLGRLSYNFRNTYFLEASFRDDGSDLFPEGNRRGFFPGVALGWVISNEKFMLGLNQKNILNYLKYRISYGEVGQNTVDGLTPFAYVPGYTLGSGYVVNGVLQPSLNMPAIPSPDITWYKMNTFNTGFEFATLSNHLSGSLDYFYLRTTNYLASASGQRYTDPLGTPLPFRLSNGAKRRAGWDGSLKYSNVAGKLSYSVGANYTYFNELWEVNPNEDSATLKNPYTTSYNQTAYLQTALLNSGLYQNAADIINNPRRLSSVLAPGDIMYVDANGDGKIDNADLRRAGSATFPRSIFGLTADLRYGSWYFSMLWQGSGKRSMYLGDVFRSNYVGNIRYDFQTEDHWTPGAGNTQFPRLVSGSGVNGGNNEQTSDFWIIDAGYVRLKALQVGYDFKPLVGNKLNFLTDLRVTLSGTNLLTFSQLKKYGLDAETGSTNNYDYPTSRVYSINVNIGF
ncbi:SusC/RagA family TonB-linked outer membrane protein [Flavihumibacter petaseus]|nr:SusC/RagA family TonB-linked outer membrane protein [Flavihumibacter petaseus]